MANLGYHMRLRLTDERVIAATARERRILSRVVLHHGCRDDLYVFDCPDNHLHLAARCNRCAAGRLTHRIGSSLRQRLRLPVGFAQYTPKPIEDNRHLYHTVRYILRQREHHGVKIDPRGEASSISDLLGLRVIGQYTAHNVQRWLPRLRRSDLLDLSALPTPPPASDPLSPEILRIALQAAGCLTDLTGSSRELVSLRTAAVAVVGHQIPAPTLAALLGINKRTVFRLRALHPNPDLVHAIRLQLSLSLSLQLCRRSSNS